MDIRENIPVIENLQSALGPSHNQCWLTVDRERTRMTGDWLHVRLKMNAKHLEKIYYYIAGENENVDTLQLEEAIRQGRMAASSLPAKEYMRNRAISFQRDRLHGLVHIYIVGEFLLPETGVRFVVAEPFGVDNRPRRVIRYELAWKQKGAPWGKYSVRSGCVLRIWCEGADTPELKLVFCHDGSIPADPAGLGTETLYTVPAKSKGFREGILEVPLKDDIWRNMKNGTQIRLLVAKEQQNRFDIQSQNVRALRVPDARGGHG